MLDILKDPDEKLLRKYLLSKNKEIVRLWIKIGRTITELIQLRDKEFAGIPITGIDMLDLFERNDTSVVERGKLDISPVILPALEVKFEDPEDCGTWYIGFIEGIDNVLKFLKGILKARPGH